MKQNKLILFISVSVVSLAVIVIVAININKDNDTAPSNNENTINTDTTSTLSNMRDEIDTSTEDEDGYHDIIISGQAIEREDIGNIVVPAAEAAALAFVQQSTRETNSERQARLTSLFSPNSTVFSSPPPLVNKSSSLDTSTTPTIISSSWDSSYNSVVVTVFLNVVTTENTSPFSEVSRIYQGYDIDMVLNSGSYVANSITPTDKPMVIRR